MKMTLETALKTGTELLAEFDLAAKISKVTGQGYAEIMAEAQRRSIVSVFSLRGHLRSMLQNAIKQK
jgi:hypothetical protein